MSKKPKVKKRDKVDTHHLLYPRTAYSQGYKKSLRDHWYLKAKVPKWSLHTQIHHEMHQIAPPSGKSAKFAYEHLLMLERYGALHKDDPIEQRLKLLIALFECGDHETVKDLKKQLWITVRYYNQPP